MSYLKGINRAWRIVRFGQIVAKAQYGLSLCATPGGRYPMLRMNNLHDGRIVPEDLVHVELSDADLEYYRVHRGDILLNRTNSADLVGKAGVFDQPGDFVFASYLVRFALQADLADPWFVGYWFDSARGKGRLRELATLGVSQCNINPTTLQKAFQLPLPSLAEQRKIAAILGTWDRAIEKLQELVTAKSKRLRALRLQLLTGARRFPEFKKARWSTVRIGELLCEVDRYVEFRDDASYKLASIRRRSGGLFFREELSGHEIKTKVMKTIQTGDFLLSKMQVVHGAWGLVTAEFDGMFVSDSYIALVPRDQSKLKVEFLDYLSRTRYLRHLAYLACHGVHIEKMTFNLTDFFHEKITIPSTVEEQMKIVATLTPGDREIELLEKQLGLLKQQKRGLMQKLLTGKVRLKPKEQQ